MFILRGPQCVPYLHISNHFVNIENVHEIQPLPGIINDAVFIWTCQDMEFNSLSKHQEAHAKTQSGLADRCFLKASGQIILSHDENFGPPFYRTALSNNTLVFKLWLEIPLRSFCSRKRALFYPGTSTYLTARSLLGEDQTRWQQLVWVQDGQTKEG